MLRNKLPKRVRAPFKVVDFGPFVMPFHRVGLLESANLSGWYTSSKAK